MIDLVEMRSERLNLKDELSVLAVEMAGYLTELGY